MPRYLFLLLLLIAHGVVAQPSFTRIYYADTNQTTGLIYGKCPRIEVTADGGYLLRYYMGQPVIDDEGFDYMIEVKTDVGLQPQWQRKVTHSITMPDGTLFAVAPNYLYGDTCMLLEKRTASGTVVWQKNICTSFSGFLRLGEATYTNSRIRMHGVMSGTFFRNVFVDVDTAGNLLRADSLTGEALFGYVEHIFADDSGNYYYVLWRTGTTSMNSRKVAKMRPDNTIAWCRIWNTPSPMHRVCGLVRLPGGDVVFAGNVATGSADERGYLLKVSAGGDIIWQKTTNRPCRPDDIGLMPNGDIAIAAGGQSYTSLSLPVEDDIIIADTGGHVKRAFNIDPDRSTWPYYSGLSLPHVRSANDWLFTALAMQPHAPIVFSTDSAGQGHCTTSPVSFTFNDSPIFTFSPSTIGFAPMLLSVTSSIQATGGTSIPYSDSCDYGMPSTSTAVVTGRTSPFSPNPASNIVRIPDDRIKEARVIDAWGRVVILMPAETKLLDVSQLPEGVYTIWAKGDSVIYYERLVVVH